MSSFLRRIPFHPLLIGIYPAVALWSQNVFEVEPATVGRAIYISAIIAILLQQVLRWVLHDLHRASLASSLVVIITLSYGHLYNFIHSPEVRGASWGRHRYFLPFIIAFIILACWWIYKKFKYPLVATEIINLISIALLILPSYNLLSYHSQSETVLSERIQPAIDNTIVNLELDSLHPPPNQTLPDIYYIILDAYARDDILKEYYDLDNSSFLEMLDEMGFYVARCSQANYSLTTLSLASSLNMVYWDQLAIDLNRVDPRVMNYATRWSVARRSLEQLGYRIVAFESGYFTTEWDDADIYLSYISYIPKPLQGINEFELMFLSITVGKVLTDFQATLPDEITAFLNLAYAERREQILFILDQLERMPEITGPKFVMAHIVAPHGPPVFGAHGEYITQIEAFTLKEQFEWSDRSEHVQRYRDQLLYINSRVEGILQQIIADSEVLPVIILQSDHGPGSGKDPDVVKMPILNSYFLPNGGQRHLYPSISPVNTFRVIFNHYFDTELELMDDVAYRSGDLNQLRLTIVPEANPECQIAIP